jgi:hypothetical protein
MTKTGVSACEHVKEKDMAVMLYVQNYKPNQKAKDEVARLVSLKPAPSVLDDKPHTHPPGFIHDEDKDKIKQEQEEIEAEI